MIRHFVACAGIAAMCATKSAAWARQAQPDLRDEVRAWASAHAIPDAIHVEWQARLPSLDQQKRASGIWITTTLASTYRWPDCFLKRTEVTDVSSTANHSTAELEPLRRGAKDTINDCRALGPEGRMVRKSDVNGVWYEDVPNYGSLRSTVLQTAEDSPFLIARWFIEIGDKATDCVVRERDSKTVQVDIASERCALELQRAMDGSLLLASFERWHQSARERPTIWKYGDWFWPADKSPALPRVRALWVFDRASAALKELRVDRLKSHEAIPAPPDDRFRLDLTNVRVLDSQTGEVRNAAGKVLGRVQVPGKISSAGQWSILFGSFGAGFAVAAGLLWWWRRRTA